MKLTKFSSLPGTTPEEKLKLWANNSPIYCQIKYHGISARYIPGKGLFTRQGKQWDLARFPATFLKDLGQIEDFVLYMELTLPGPFPAAAGVLNVNSDVTIPSSLIAYLFDVEHLTKPATEQAFSWRLAQIQTFPPFTHITPAATYIHTDAIYADRRYNRVIEADYEGVVYRTDPAFLLYGDTPNPFMVKRKRLHTDEGICIGVEEGKGKRKGMAGYLVLRLANNKQLRVGGGAGMTEKLLADLLANPPLNKPVTFSYEELSEAGIPLRPQFISVRSYE